MITKFTQITDDTNKNNKTISHQIDLVNINLSLLPSKFLLLLNLSAPQIRFLDLVRIINDFIVLYCIVSTTTTAFQPMHTTVSSKFLNYHPN